MPTINVKITNLAQIKAAFKQAPALTVKYIDKAIRTSIFQVEADSKRGTPVDTGYLRSSHQSSFSMMRGEIMPRASYAIYVHEGTSRMRGRPFLMNAVKTNEKNIQNNFEIAMQHVFDNIAEASK